MFGFFFFFKQAYLSCKTAYVVLVHDKDFAIFAVITRMDFHLAAAQAADALRNTRARLAADLLKRRIP